MPRNKYPEETVQKILDVATRLFIEKGYENTTIGDIVDNLGGMTRGAVYHHFKSKADILDAVANRLYDRNDPFALVRGQTDDGLAQLRLALRYSIEGDPNDERLILNRQLIELLREPKYLAQQLSECMMLAEREVLPLLEKANAAGTLHLPYPKQAAEMVMLVLNFWLLYSNQPIGFQEFEDRLNFAAGMLDDMGLPLIDEEMKAQCLRTYGTYFVDKVPSAAQDEDGPRAQQEERI